MEERSRASVDIERMCRAICEAYGQDPDGETVVLPGYPSAGKEAYSVPNWRFHEEFCAAEYKRSVALGALVDD